MHSSRMRTARSLTVSPYLIISHARPPGATTHTPWSNHACPRATMHAPRATTHAPPKSNHARAPPSNHACPPSNHTYPPPRATMHASLGATTHPPEQPRMPPVNRITDRCKNITVVNYVCGR